jgi:hypothetical protein
MNLQIDPQVEFFDRASVPPQIQELLAPYTRIDGFPASRSGRHRDAPKRPAAGAGAPNLTNDQAT